MRGVVGCLIAAAFFAGMLAGWGLYHSPSRVNNNYITYEINHTYKVVSENAVQRPSLLRAVSPESGEI